MLKIFKVDKGDNGTYHCHYDDKSAAPVLLKVLSKSVGLAQRWDS